MRDEQNQFLALVGQPPARLTVEQAAWVLGCQPHDVPVLVSSRLLKPLGNPPANGVKYFSTRELVELVQDRSWLAKMTNTICQHWHKKNGKGSAGKASSAAHPALVDFSQTAGG
jgi:hypothetical protein